MRYSLIFTTVLAALTCAFALPHGTPQANGLSIRVSNLFVALTCALGVPYSTPVSDHSKDAAPYVRNGMELGREAQYTLPWASYPVLWLTDSGGTVDEVPGIIIYYLFWDDNASAWELSVQFEDAESGAEYVFIPRRGAGGSIKPTKNGWYTLQYKASEPTIVRVEIRPQ